MNPIKPAHRCHRSNLALAVAAALARATALPAWAQDEPDEAAAPDATTLDTVVVTANKREENIREVAAAISVIGERQLENIGANSLTDYAGFVPGLQVQDNGAPGMTSISIRGIAA